MFVGIVVLLWPHGATFAEVVEKIHEAGPVPYFAALALLPCLGLPTTPFFLLAGPAFGVPVSIIGSALALAIQFSVTYWLARNYLRAWMESLVARTKYSIPEVRPKHYWTGALLIKLPPGVHPAFKHSVMALAGIPFPIYFVVAWPLSVVYGIGAILVGDSVWDRDVHMLAVGLVLIVLVVLAVRWLGHRYARPSADDSSPRP